MFFLFPSEQFSGGSMLVFGGCTFSAGILDALHHVTFGHELLHEVPVLGGSEAAIREIFTLQSPQEFSTQKPTSTNLKCILYINLSRKQASLRRGRPFSCHPIFRIIAASFPTPAVASANVSTTSRNRAARYSDHSFSQSASILDRLVSLRSGLRKVSIRISWPDSTSFCSSKPCQLPPIERLIGWSDPLVMRRCHQKEPNPMWETASHRLGISTYYHPLKTGISICHHMSRSPNRPLQP